MFSDDHIDAFKYAIERSSKVGCDIHWHSETKRDGKWLCDQAESFKILNDEGDYPDMNNFPDRGRDYWFFGLIQPGVRSEWSWSLPERLATPDDLSKEVQIVMNHWDGDAHSHGYRTREELKTKLAELKQLMVAHLIAPTDVTEVLHHHVKRLKKVIKDLASDVPDTDQRIIFWFDN